MKSKLFLFFLFLLIPIEVFSFWDILRFSNDIKVNVIGYVPEEKVMLLESDSTLRTLSSETTERIIPETKIKKSNNKGGKSNGNTKKSKKNKPNKKNR